MEQKKENSGGIVKCHRCHVYPVISIGENTVKDAEGKILEHVPRYGISCLKCGETYDGTDIRHVQDTWNYWNTHFLYMEDVSDIALEALCLIEKRLSQYGICLTDEELDVIYCPLKDAIEERSNGEYRNHN